MGIIETAIFEPKLGDRIRLLLEYKGEWKAMFWIKVGTDGSVYLAPRILDPKSIRKGSTKSSDDGMIAINYNEGEIVEVGDYKQPPKISFHASGIVNSQKEREFRKSLRSLTEQELLCSIFFQHPDRFDSIESSKLKNRDICLQFPMDEEFPIFAYVFVAPTAECKFVDMNTEKYQINILLPYNNIDGIGDMTVQLCIVTPTKGPWPPYTYIMYPTT